MLINMWSEERNGRHHVAESEHRVEISKRYGFNMGVGKGKEKRGSRPSFPSLRSPSGLRKVPVFSQGMPREVPQPLSPSRLLFHQF